MKKRNGSFKVTSITMLARMEGYKNKIIFWRVPVVGRVEIFEEEGVRYLNFFPTKSLSGFLPCFCQGLGFKREKVILTADGGNEEWYHFAVDHDVQTTGPNDVIVNFERFILNIEVPP